MSDKADKDVWDAVAESGAADDSGRPANPLDEHFGSADEEAAQHADNGADPVDQGGDDQVVDATEVAPKKKKSILYVVLVIGAIMVGAVGYTGMKLYRTIVPAKASVDAPASASVLGDVGASRMSSGTLPAPGTAGGAQAALVGGGVSAPTRAEPPVATASAVPATPVVPAAAVALPAAVEPVPVVAAAPIVAAAKPVEIAPVEPVKVAEKPKAKPEAAADRPADRATERPAKPVAAESAKPAKPVKAKPVRVARAEPVAPVAKKAKPEKVKAEKPTAIEPAPVARPVVEADAGQLTQYSVVAYEPKIGDHQQAWVRSRDGKLQIVQAGDELGGAKVIDVRFELGRVKTSQGDVR